MFILFRKAGRSPHEVVVHPHLKYSTFLLLFKIHFACCLLRFTSKDFLRTHELFLIVKDNIVYCVLITTLLSSKTKSLRNLIRALAILIIIKILIWTCPMGRFYVLVHMIMASLNQVLFRYYLNSKCQVKAFASWAVTALIQSKKYILVMMKTQVLYVCLSLHTVCSRLEISDSKNNMREK